MKINYKIDGEKELETILKKLELENVSSILEKAVNKTSISILGAATQNIKNNGSQVTGETSTSGRVIPMTINSSSISSGVEYKNDSAWYLEHGRRAGGMPPIDAIERWANKKNIDIPAFVIARAIGKYGTKAHPFLNPAFEKNKNSLTDNIKKYYNEYIEGIKG